MWLIQKTETKKLGERVISQDNIERNKQRKKQIKNEKSRITCIPIDNKN